MLWAVSETREGLPIGASAGAETLQLLSEHAGIEAHAQMPSTSFSTTKRPFDALITAEACRANAHKNHWRLVLQVHGGIVDAQALMCHTS